MRLIFVYIFEICDRRVESRRGFQPRRLSTASVLLICSVRTIFLLKFTYFVSRFVRDEIYSQPSSPRCPGIPPNRFDFVDFSVPIHFPLFVDSCCVSSVRYSTVFRTPIFFSLTSLFLFLEPSRRTIRITKERPNTSDGPVLVGKSPSRCLRLLRVLTNAK